MLILSSKPVEKSKLPVEKLGDICGNPVEFTGENLGKK
jgi:hypothetical protein